MCMCMCTSGGGGVVDMFTMDNEPISGTLGGDVGVPIKGMGVTPSFLFRNVGHFPSSGDFPCVSVGTITPPPLKTHIKSLTHY